MRRIKNFAIIILMMTIVIISGTKVDATTGKVNSETVNLREQPNSSKESKILDQLDKGDEVEILEQEEGWYKVKAKTEQGTVTGYISEKLLDVEKTTSDKKDKTTTDAQTNANVSTNKETSTNTGKTNGIITEFQDKELSSEDIEINEPSNEPINETISTDIIEETEVVTTTEIKENKEFTIGQEISVRTLPLINSIEKGKIVGNARVIEIINDWCRIENDTEIGWIRKNNLKKVLTTDVPVQEPEEQPEQQPEQQPEETKPVEDTTSEETKKPDEKPAETTINKIGYVDAEGLVIRKEPTTSSEELHSLSRNDKVEIIGQSGKWYEIKYDGEIGYVSSKYISDTKVPETTSRSGSSLKEDKKENEIPVQNENVQEEKNENKQEEIPVAKEETPAVQEKPTTSGTTGAAVVEYAKQYLKYKYVSGGASPSTGFDCSGFTLYVYKHFGISLNRSSKDQIKNGVAAEKSDLQLGDIVIFNNDANTAIGHVGIYVGDGNFIHASNPSDGVKITTLTTGYYQKRYVGARRVI